MVKRFEFRGWAIVGWFSLALALMVAIIFATSGTTEEGLHAILRATARTSFTFFISAYFASSLYKVWRTGISRWLLANRRYLGVSFAISHLIHGFAIILLAIITAGTGRFVLNKVTLIGGGFAFLFIIAMAVTSFDRTAAWLGSRNWRRLHSTGMHLLWLVFLTSYGGRAIKSIYYIPLAALLLIGVSLRLFASFSRREKVVTQRT